MPPLTRGPLPAGVYWRRRIFVLALAAALVFVIASWLGAGSDGTDGEVPTARQAGGRVDASQTITVSERKKAKKGRRVSGAQQGPTFDPDVLVEPDGNCEPADVQVTPQVEEAVAGQPVTIGLNLQTTQAEACYFRIGSDKVTLKIMKGGQEIWTSQECPDPVPEESVVVRRVVATVVPMEWTPYPRGPRGRECPGTDDWLLPGDLTVVAAALGGEPTESDFELVSPAPETITDSPDPKQDRQDDQRDQRDRAGEQGEQDEEQEQQPDDAESSKPPRR